jgi:hypothetical protein
MGTHQCACGDVRVDFPLCLYYFASYLLLSFVVMQSESKLVANKPGDLHQAVNVTFDLAPRTSCNGYISG